MSQEVSYSQVQRVREIAISDYAESVAKILGETICTASTQVAANQQRIETVQNINLSHPSTTILQSPTSLKVIQKHFERNLATLNKSETKSDEVSIIKAAAIMTMQQENLKIENKPLIMRSIQELMNASTVKQTTEKLTTAFSDIKNEHAKVFNNTLSSAIQIASSNVGFVNIKSEIVSPNLTRIVATNPNGYNLISEIHIDNKKKVDIQSELEGITDGSCKKIMDDFNKELESLGVIAERKERKPTGGIAQMEYAKTLQKRRKATKREFVNEQVLTKDNKNKTVQYINKK
ncbi:hypothetical protein [Parabacteroides sp. PF5-9]|uniref:hypothetical protein n=1 Tax=Parabacteroides sp. PF5-9 TaxID=1742404 RepID=UPI002474D1AE|nr:hypothetical protein [Parabacteroides sp. PF5-9]MDH6357800.1 hypothetical protein [Parabacteroides sp. PF5-9]